MNKREDVRAPGEVEHGLAVVVGDLDLHGGLGVDLDQDEWQRQRSGRSSVGRGNGRQRARRPVQVAHDQVAVRRVLLACLLGNRKHPRNVSNDGRGKHTGIGQKW